MKNELGNSSFKMPVFPSLLLKVLDLTQVSWAKDLVEEITNVVRGEGCRRRRDIYTDWNKQELFAILDEKTRCDGFFSFNLKGIPVQYWVIFIFLEIVVYADLLNLGLSMSFSSTVEILFHRNSHRSGCDRRISSSFDRLYYGINLCFKEMDSQVFKIDHEFERKMIVSLSSEFLKYTFLCKNSLCEIEQIKVLEETVARVFKDWNSISDIMQLNHLKDKVFEQVFEKFDIKSVDRRLPGFSQKVKLV